jgi:hypothetical protein
LPKLKFAERTLEPQTMQGDIMSDPTIRIEAANSFRQPDGGPDAYALRTKQRPKLSSHGSEPIASIESDTFDDDRDEHGLDTVA